MFLPPSNFSDPRNTSILATPLTHSVDTCHDIDNCRTLWDIVRSCLVTIFACTWVSLHLNIPPQNEAWYRGPLRHLGVTLMAIIAPELVVAWAARQWCVARELEAKYRVDSKRTRKPWTRTHGFFALMGGYVLYDDRGPEVLDVDFEGDFRDFFSSHDSCTRLTEEELGDKGKKDWLSKTFAVVQTAWFILQCIARSVQHIALSELEVATCGFAVLNAVTYYLWWNKPQGVRLPFAVDKPVESEKAYEQHPTAKLLKLQEHTTFLNIYRDRFRSMLPSGVFYAFFEMAGHDHMHIKEISGTSVPTFYSGDRTPYRDDIAIAISVCFSVIFGAIHCLVWTFAFPTDTEALLWRACALAITCLPALRLLTHFAHTWAPAAYDFMAGDVLGKRTPVRRGWGWRAMGVLVRMVNRVGVVLYVTARFILLVLVFTLLRSLPETAFETVSWASFIPHV